MVVPKYPYRGLRALQYAQAAVPLGGAPHGPVRPYGGQWGSPCVPMGVNGGPRVSLWGSHGSQPAVPLSAARGRLTLSYGGQWGPYVYPYGGVGCAQPAVPLGAAGGRPTKPHLLPVPPLLPISAPPPHSRPLMTHACHMTHGGGGVPAPRSAGLKPPPPKMGVITALRLRAAPPKIKGFLALPPPH